ncbi:MAG: hypothetical protein EKK38_09785 [Hyphomicrobium sp.]|nr:MAG: hypothetical protein EKK38_09785 [Hyphomicrobium sp.]
MARALFLFAVLITAFCGLGAALAQEGPGGALGIQRDCQVLTTCNFKRGRGWRGCLSSYSCRRCETVPGPCVGGGPRKRICGQLICDWAGS